MPIRRKLAIVGAGIGRRHMEEGYLPYPDLFEVVAICDIDPQRLAAFAADYGIPRATPSFAEVLAMPDVEIVDICTPNFLHPPVAIAAAKAGKHIVSEKPLANTLKEADAMLAAAKAGKIKHMCGFSYRFAPAVQAINMPSNHCHIVSPTACQNAVSPKLRNNDAQPGARPSRPAPSAVALTTRRSARAARAARPTPRRRASPPPRAPRSPPANP